MALRALGALRPTVSGAAKAILQPGAREARSLLLSLAQASSLMSSSHHGLMTNSPLALQGVSSLPVLPVTASPQSPLHQILGQLSPGFNQTDEDLGGKAENLPKTLGSVSLHPDDDQLDDIARQSLNILNILGRQTETAITRVLNTVDELLTQSEPDYGAFIDEGLNLEDFESLKKTVVGRAFLEGLVDDILSSRATVAAGVGMAVSSTLYPVQKMVTELTATLSDPNSKLSQKFASSISSTLASPTQGITAATLKSMLSRPIEEFLKENLRELCPEFTPEQLENEELLNTAKEFIVGAVAGSVTAVLTNPANVLITKAQSGKSYGECVRELFSDPKTMAAGLKSTILRNATWMSTYTTVLSLFPEEEKGGALAQVSAASSATVLSSGFNVKRIREQLGAAKGRVDKRVALPIILASALFAIGSTVTSQQLIGKAMALAPKKEPDQSK